MRLNAPALTLRPMREADLDTIASPLPADVEQDPAATRYDVGDPSLSRGIISHQSYWDAWGTCRPEAWRLSFVVTTDGQVIGVQELEGTAFPRLRTVDSSSFLIPSGRGRGWGKQMRSAVLALAFGPLGAQAAISSAWHDNHASLGLSRALGYRRQPRVLPPARRPRRPHGPHARPGLAAVHDGRLREAATQLGEAIACYVGSDPPFGVPLFSRASGRQR